MTIYAKSGGKNALEKAGFEDLSPFLISLILFVSHILVLSPFLSNFFSWYFHFSVLFLLFPSSPALFFFCHRPIIVPFRWSKSFSLPISNTISLTVSHFTVLSSGLETISLGFYIYICDFHGLSNYIYVWRMIRIRLFFNP